MPGAHNDINVLHRSPIFARYADGEQPPVSFTVNGNTYDMGYYLTDGIYPDWPAFVKSVRQPLDMKTQHFARVQESARKDIEHAFESYKPGGKLFVDQLTVGTRTSSQIS